MIRQTSAQRL